MPNTMVHLKIASIVSAKNPLYLDSDFYLGSVLPDAVLSRKIYLEELKNKTHLFTDTASWEKNTINNFSSICEPTLLDRGYYSHIYTDIIWRRKMREFYDSHSVPVYIREQYDRIIVNDIISDLFNKISDYYDCVNIAAKSSVTEYLFGITKADVDSEIDYAFHCFNFKKQTDILPFEKPSFLLWCSEIADKLVDNEIVQR